MTTPDPGYLRRLNNAQEAYVPSAGGALVIDVDKARDAVRLLREAADQLAQLRRHIPPGRIDSPASDPVSRNAAEQATRMVLAGRDYLRQWHDDLVAAITALETQIADYQSADRANSARA